MSLKQKVAREIADLLGIPYVEASPIFFKLSIGDLNRLRNAVRIRLDLARKEGVLVIPSRGN